MALANKNRSVAITVTGARAPNDLTAAFWSYDEALRANDIDELDVLFADETDTVRIDPSGILAGADKIAAFRRARAFRAVRTVVGLHATRLDDDAYVLVANTHVTDRGPGCQTQVWQRTPEGWKVRAAHVSSTPAPVDAATWRVRADPLVAPAAAGPLSGERVAVKDLFAVAGHRVGAGVPAYLADATPAPASAAAVSALVGAGASVIGIAHCDELAFGLEGANPHSGTSRNARAIDRLPGGSSSGSASAVAAGEATIGLATDTAGSIRVPASYQGLWGLRTTHGSVSTEGALPLAPSFDAIGWLTRDPVTLICVLGVHGLDTGAGADGAHAQIAVTPALAALADAAVTARLDAVTAGADVFDLDLGEPFEGWFAAFRASQAFEAWERHGAWISAHPGALAPGTEARFRVGAGIDAADAREAAALLGVARARVIDALGERILVLPSAAGVAPRIGDDTTGSRDRTLRLGALAAIAGLPALSAPVLAVEGLPVGVTFFGAPGRDGDLVRCAARLIESTEESRAASA